jgi:hypothetical protein
VPLDAAGIYEFTVKVPNITGFPISARFTSNIEFSGGVPTARSGSSADLHAVDETSPASFGSDEIGIRSLTRALQRRQLRQLGASPNHRT